jgi:hypothetical protein
MNTKAEAPSFSDGASGELIAASDSRIAAEACPFYGPWPPGARSKIAIVGLLAALLELSPALAMALGRLVLRLWPGMREA